MHLNHEPIIHNLPLAHTDAFSYAFRSVKMSLLFAAEFYSFDRNKGLIISMQSNLTNITLKKSMS